MQGLVSYCREKIFLILEQTPYCRRYVVTMKCLLKKANYILKLTRGISLTMFTEVTCPKDLAQELHVGTLYFPFFRSKGM
jgi:hypothetical protein